MTFLENLKDAVTASGVQFGYGKRPELVYVTQADGTKNPKPWVVAWPDGGTTSADTMKWNDGKAVVITFRCYGMTPESAAVGVRRVESASYAQHRTVVDGRQMRWPEQLTAVPLAREDETDPPAFVYAVEWRYRSSPVDSA